MLKSVKRVLARALDRAGLAVASAEHAYSHFGDDFTRWTVCTHWAEGFFEGLAMGMKEVRSHQPSFNPDYQPSVRFKVAGNNLLVEVDLSTADGTVKPVLSTLSYGEAMAAASGLKTLRGTGVFALNDEQAAAFIRATEELKAARIYEPPRSQSTTRPATR
ncbi:hypothetical protein K5E40_07625 [Pseudomonas baetica]|uniref:hypothetical protein n=1 Tax=Pseudomonas TaxID=286 RepID=UPI0018925662|nr:MULTISPECIES: hypothetical protein [Pseudomonas]MBF6043346.1 hypothetical protein [Pseudomonas mucoides]MBX9405550.1 hypothetical protein [Pseudomonas baetica]WHT75658.1 hypothetical protein QMY54_00393 [Pseudomonas rhodesiae]